MPDDDDDDVYRPRSYFQGFTSRFTPEQMASFFRATAAIYRARPWESFEMECVFGVSFPPSPDRGIVMCFVGHYAPPCGIAVFSRIEDFGPYSDAVRASQRGHDEPMPPHTFLRFVPRAEIAPALAAEVAEHGWELGGVDGYPWLVGLNEVHDLQEPLAAELAELEAIALALPAVLADEARVLHAWKTNESLVVTTKVRAHDGEHDVTLRVPFREPQPLAPRDRELLDQLDQLMAERREIIRQQRELGILDEDDEEDGEYDDEDGAEEEELSPEALLQLAEMMRRVRATGASPSDLASPRAAPRATPTTAQSAKKKSERKAARRARKKGR